jgi:hypothetical protein
MKSLASTVPVKEPHTLTKPPRKPGYPLCVNENVSMVVADATQGATKTKAAMSRRKLLFIEVSREVLWTANLIMKR